MLAVQGGYRCSYCPIRPTTTRHTQIAGRRENDFWNERGEQRGGAEEEGERDTQRISKKHQQPRCTAVTFRELTGESRRIEGVHHRSAVSSKISHCPVLAPSNTKELASVPQQERQNTSRVPLSTTSCCCFPCARRDLELDRGPFAWKFVPHTLSL